MTRDEHNPFKEFLPAGEVPERPDSDATFATIEDWNHTCLSSHRLCNLGPMKRSLPTRLLEISADNESLKLVAGSDFPESTQFTALSHSWGAKKDRIKPIPKTTRANIDCRQKSVPWDDLTQTFQDAVTATRRLGFGAIWIDSLCIIQDNEVDWAMEASRMSINYENAAIVISASSSRTGDNGCFGKRESSQKVTRADSNGQLVSVHVKRPIAHTSFSEQNSSNFSDLPLFQRAWVFQERLLGTRVVHYASSEVVWECKECVQCECQGMDNPLRTYHNQVGKIEMFKQYHALVLTKGNNVNERYERWFSIVQAYSRRSLAFDSDRLPALSGIAGQMHLPEMGRYMAGVWERAIPRALLWSSSSFELVSRRPTEYRAPSWSWASIEGHIMEWIPEDADGVEQVCQLQEIETSLVSHDPYGQVSNGHLRIRAPCFPAVLQYDKVKVLPSDPDEPRYVVIFDHNNHPEYLERDVPLHQGEGFMPSGSAILVAFLICIDLSVTSINAGYALVGNKGNKYLGLILQRLPEKRLFGSVSETVHKRIGKIGVRSDRLERAVEGAMQEVVLV